MEGPGLTTPKGSISGLNKIQVISDR